MLSSPNKRTLPGGYGSALLSAAVFSTTGIFIRHLTVAYALPPLVLAFWRNLFVVVTLLPILALVRPGLLRVERGHLLYLAAFGLVLAAYNALWTLSVALNGAAVATVLCYGSVAYTAFLGWWFLRESLSAAKLAAIALSLSGCALISGAFDPAVWRVNPLGILTGILSGLGYAAYSLLGRKAAQRSLNPWTTLLYTFVFAAAYLLLVDLVAGGRVPGSAARPADLFWLRDALPGWGLLYLLAAGPTLGGYGLYNISLGRLPSSVANLILTLEPPFTAVIAYALLGERMSLVQIGGGLLILAGVLVLRGYGSRPSVENSPPTRMGEAPTPS